MNVRDMVETRIAAELQEMTDDDLRQVYYEAQAWDGSFDFLDTYDIEDIADMLSGYELARAIIYGDVTNICEPVRFNGYGNLENVSEWEIDSEAQDNIPELAYWLVDNIQHVTMPNCIESDNIAHVIDLYERMDTSDETIEACRRMFTA